MAIPNDQAARMFALARGDWQGLRAAVNALQMQTMGSLPLAPDVRVDMFSTQTRDAEIELRWYSKRDARPGPAVVYAHGGGMILSSAKIYDAFVSEYVAETGVSFLSVDYRLAPEAQGTTLAEDVFAGLSWLLDRTSELGLDPARIAVMGDSAGGGVAAGAAILARDRGIALARQLLIYPMLDDRNVTPDPKLAPYLTWTYDHNYTGWSALLGSAIGGATVSPVAAPARLEDFGGLAPAYIEVGELDIFRDESIAYAQGIAAAGIPFELHVHPGAPHAFERAAPHSLLARRAMADRMRVIRSV
jgi:acetyl esterase/lipase